MKKKKTHGVAMGYEPLPLLGVNIQLEEVTA
jgi:hypothetical protein